MSNSLFSQFPSSERIFLVDKAHDIMQKTSSGSVEDILMGIGNQFAGKSSGWEEAILSGLWYRFPSEVQKQFFCSERALEDFLLAHTLGFNAQYVEVLNYNNSGMHHEMVLIPSNGKLYAVDWGRVVPVTLSNSGLLIEGTNHSLVTFNDMNTIPSEHISHRARDLRSGETFLQAIQMGQHLYRRDSEFAQVDGIVKFFHKPGREALIFNYHILPKTTSIRSYFEDATYFVDGQSVKFQEHGILRMNSGFSGGRIPLLQIYDAAGKTHWRHVPFYCDLTEPEREELSAYLAYDAGLRSKSHGKKAALKDTYLFNEESRMSFFANLPQWSREDSEMGRYMRSVLHHSANIWMTKDTKGFHRYLDYVLFSEGFLLHHDDPEKAAMEMANISNEELRDIAIHTVFTRMLHGVLSQKDNETSQLNLARVFHDKTKIPMTRDSNPLYCFDALRRLEMEQNYPLDFNYQR